MVCYIHPTYCETTYYEPITSLGSIVFPSFPFLNCCVVLLCDCFISVERNYSCILFILVLIPLPQHLSSSQTLMYLASQRHCEVGQCYNFKVTDGELSPREMKELTRVCTVNLLQANSLTTGPFFFSKDDFVLKSGYLNCAHPTACTTVVPQAHTLPV